MYIPRLDEFTTDELGVLHKAVVKMRYQLNLSDPDIHEEMETLLLWQTQINNAMDKVRKQEQINNN